MTLCCHNIEMFLSASGPCVFLDEFRFLSKEVDYHSNVQNMAGTAWLKLVTDHISRKLSSSSAFFFFVLGVFYSTLYSTSQMHQEQD